MYSKKHFFFFFFLRLKAVAPLCANGRYHQVFLCTVEKYCKTVMPPLGPTKTHPEHTQNRHEHGAPRCFCTGQSFSTLGPCMSKEAKHFLATQTAETRVAKALSTRPVALSTSTAFVRMENLRLVVVIVGGAFHCIWVDGQNLWLRS